MNIRKIAYNRLALLISLVCICSVTSLRASHEVGTARLTAATATINSTLFIQDNKYPAIASMSGFSTWGFYDVAFKNKLTLGINRYHTAALADFVATVTVQVSSTRPQALGGGVTVVTKTLSVSYEGKNDHQSASPHASVDKDIYTFTNGYKVVTKILGISVSSSDASLNGSVLPANVYLEAETDAERYYPLETAASPFLNNADVSIKYLVSSDEFEVSWARIEGAEQYDLEWLWLDGEKNSYWIADPQLDFRNNSTRVRTSQQSYRVSNIFEKGQVFFRIRGVGKASLLPDAWEKDAYTPWSWQDLTTIVPAGIAATNTVITTAAPGYGTDRLFYLSLDGSTLIPTTTPSLSAAPPIHEFNKNWQYKATYAEEGKKKEVVSYFDGSLRSRQSVTKNNSDNNAIVGETYYDYNGRAAVQALPVPVQDATIKFYQYNVTGTLSAFNVALQNNQPYSKKHFDEENPANTGTTCAVFVSGLDPVYGSSKYYSDHNLNRQFAQGYVPDAENFPISQTVYTNDNTGRIAAQGGVGKTHQVGTGHETKYLYGTPVQAELDRLFGSEVGYNVHYKKNMVIDANGQVSISYLDQEGRTIATALSGQGPNNLSALKNTAGQPLYPVPSATNIINADLLNKANSGDYDTSLDNNRRQGDELTFTKKILVPTAGTYTVSYDLEGTSFTYSCLPTNACYDCVYDLEINVFDNCMNNPPGFSKITQTLGNIVPPASQNGTATSSYSLDLACNQVVHFSTSQLNYSGSHLLLGLEQGEYTITKTLKINQEAMSFYLNDYLKSNCVKQPDDFANVTPDTSGCGLSCDECIAALGTKQDYLDNHKGTAEDWEQEYKICREPCEYLSLCDAEYITMLADVSPGGQYGDWEDNQGNCNTALYPLSVYNTNNYLPSVKNFSVGTQVPTWQNPFHRSSIYQGNQPSDFTREYYDDDEGTVVSRIYVTKLSSGPDVYLPAVAAGVVPTPVNAGAGVGGQFYVKPQQLAKVDDFISNWRNSWAKSLVFYHPEYAYYDWCLKNTTRQLSSPYTVTVGSGTNTITGSVSNSEHYDSLLLVTDDVVGMASGELAKLCQPMTYDPYWTTNGYYYDHGGVYSRTVTGTQYPQKVSGPYTGITSPWNTMFNSATYRFDNYQNSGVSLPAFAAIITTSCVIQYGQPISNQLACLATVLSPTLTAAQTNSLTADQIVGLMPANLKNTYWDNFRMLYLSMKQGLQQEAAASYAMNGDYRGCNDAIGDPNFDPQAMTVPFTEYHTFGHFPAWMQQQQWFFPYFTVNDPQYSNLHVTGLGNMYGSKIRRFANAADAMNLTRTMPGGDPGAALYAKTGLCPNAFYFQNFVNSLAVNNRITSATLNLSTIPEFNKDLYTVVANGVIPSTFTPANWTASNSSHVLTASMQIGTNPTCGLTLNFPAGLPFNFSNTGNGGTYAFLKLYHLVPGTASGGIYNFSIRADVALASGSSQTYTTVTLGGTTCIPLTGCSFTPPCEATIAAAGLQKIINAVAATGNMCSSTVPMSDVNIQPYFVNTFAPLLGAGNWVWAVNGTLPNFIIKDANTVNTNTNSITITLNASPCTSGSQISFAHVTGNLAGNNVFGMVKTTITTSGSSVSTSTAAITGTVNLNGQPLAMGKCSFDIDKCNTPQHQLKRDLETYLSSPNTVAGLQSASTNLTPDYNFSINLRGVLAGSYQAYNPSTLATTPLNYYWKKNAAASTATLLTGAFVASTLTSVPSPLDASACTFSLSFADPANLSGQNLLTSSYTLGNFVLDPGPTVNNSLYNFSVTAYIGRMPFTLKGSSNCFGMRACDECVSSSTGSLSSSQTFTVNNYPCTGSPTFTISENIGGALTIYRDATSSCSSSTLNLNPAYVITESTSYEDSRGGIGFTWNAYNSGSSLFIRRANANEFKYQQEYSYSSDCNQFEVRFKLHNHGTPDPSGVYTQAYSNTDFYVRNNNGPSLNFIASLPTADPNWTEYRFGNATNVNGVPNNIQIYGFDNVSESYIGLDELKLVTVECTHILPCTSPQDSLSPFPEVEYEDPCVQYALDAAENEGNERYNTYVDSVKNAFVQAYIQKCMGNAVEKCYMKYNAGDYHFTLYYYDQAGNLVRTVPPEGVQVETNAANLALILSERNNKTPYAAKTYYTSHNLATTYSYNSLNQLVKQETPDAGISRFWYDALGRLVASQNAKQAITSIPGFNIYSYTRYDDLGRIAQVGEMTTASNLSGMKAAAVATLVASGTLPYPDNLSFAKREVTNTYYGDDQSFTPLVAGSAFTAGSQEYLRSRVASVTIEDSDDGNSATYNHATHYSYDVHGNVKELIQENRDISLFSYQKLKKISYSYDLISGKVNEVAYQRGLKDMFLHRYEYDADNRITAVYTSKNDVVWDRDAKYFYYLHGPLARVETGHDKVQGTDYAYTLHGWIKGVNSNILKADNDIGKDGKGSLILPSADVNKFNGRDVYSYSLTYFGNSTQKDYQAINSMTGSLTDFMASAPSVQTADLYNGNIRQMSTSYLDASAPARSYSVSALLKNYTYDQLNRIETATSNNGLNIAGNAWGAATGGARYAESFSYDQNGNIQKVQRNGDQSGSLAMDNLSYHYMANSNKLAYVSDAVSGDPYSTDISNQSAGNYDYDAIGNLVKDNAEGISRIDWTVYGKIKKITFNNGKPNLLFGYDASGNRVSKTAYSGSAVSNTATTTYYVRDAQGNVMATYEQKPDVGNTPVFSLNERHIYGSSRLGMENSHLDLTTYTNSPIDLSSVTRTLGNKAYELSNHLGNVVAVVSDRKIAVANNGVCKTCQDIKTVYDAFVVSNIAVTTANIGAFTTYANAQLGVTGSQSDYEQALTDCRLLTKVLKFNGNTAVTSNNTANLNLGNGDVSVEAWVNIQASSSGYNLILNNIELFGSVFRGIQLFTYNHQLYFAAYDGGTSGAAHIGSANTNIIPYGQWTHVVATKTGSGPASFAMYVNGVSISFNTYNTDSPDAIGMNNASALEIGWEHTFHQYANGFYRNVRIFNRSLSGTEVISNYNGGCITEPATTTGLIYYAKLNEGTGTAIADWSGNGLSSVVTNGTWSYESMPGTGCLTSSDLSKQLCYFTSSASLNTISYFTGEVLSANDYYAFGATMPGRSFTSANYRYGFNGKENDSETVGTGSGTQDYGMRIYNPALGKFLSVDPLAKEYAWNSTYAFAENRPIDGIDLDGEEWLSGLLDLYDKTIPQLEAANANKTLVYSAKVIRGMMNSTLEGQVRGMGNELKNTYNSAEKFARNPQTAESRQFVKELIKHPDVKSGEGLVNIAKGVIKGDPDAIGVAAGTLLQMGVMKLGVPKATTIPEYGGGAGRKINPSGGQYNCAGCAQAGDATLKGYPSSALNHGVTSAEAVLEHFGMKEIGWTTENSFESLSRKMPQLGEGATGVIFGWNPGAKMGHFFNVLTVNGKAVFLDFQKAGSAVMTEAEVSAYKNLNFINTTGK